MQQALFSSSDKVYIIFFQIKLIRKQTALMKITEKPMSMLCLIIIKA